MLLQESLIARHDTSGVSAGGAWSFTRPLGLGRVWKPTTAFPTPCTSNPFSPVWLVVTVFCQVSWNLPLHRRSSRISWLLEKNLHSYFYIHFSEVPSLQDFSPSSHICFLSTKPILVKSAIFCFGSILTNWKLENTCREKYPKCLSDIILLSFT